MVVRTDHELFLDDVALLVAVVMATLGVDECTLKQENPPLFIQLFVTLLTSEQILRRGVGK